MQRVQVNNLLASTAYLNDVYQGYFWPVLPCCELHLQR